MLIRFAQKEDAQALFNMNHDFNGDTGVSEAHILSSLESGREIVVVAEENKTAVGFLCAFVHFSFCYPRPVCEIAEMYVSPPFRRKGAAKGMLHFLSEHIKTVYGADECHLLTGRTNLKAQALYKACGFTEEDEMYMHKDL